MVGVVDDRNDWGLVMQVDIPCHYCDEDRAELQYPVYDGTRTVGYQCEGCAETEHDAYWSGMVSI